MPGVTTAYQTGNHAGRPDASAGCILYACTTHGLIYRSDGSAWATWATLGGGAPAAHAASHEDGGADEIDVTGLAGTGGGGGVPSPEWWHSDNAPAGADDLEFTEGAVIGTLTRVADATPKGTWVEIDDGLEWTQTATIGDELDVFAVPLSLSIGDHLTIAGRINGDLPGAGSALGPLVGFSNGTVFGTSDAVGAHGIVSSPFALLLNPWVDMNSRGANGTVQQIPLTEGARFGLRIKWQAANTWGLYTRRPGGGWRTIQTNFAMTLTPTHAVFGIGTLGTTFDATIPYLIRLECFRVND